MPLKTIVPVLFILASVAPAIHAADSESGLTDVRLEGVLLPEHYDYAASAESGGGISGSADFDRAFRIGLAAISHQRGASPIGLVGGGALYYSRLAEDHGNVSEHYDTLSVQARLGLGLYFGDIFHVEAAPFIGVGGARGTINSDESDIGLYWEYGISGGAFANIGDSAQLGIIGGWMHGKYDLDFNHDANFPGPADNVNEELVEEGIFIGISLGSRM